MLRSYNYFTNVFMTLILYHQRGAGCSRNVSEVMRFCIRPLDWILVWDGESSFSSLAGNSTVFVSPPPPTQRELKREMAWWWLGSRWGFEGFTHLVCFDVLLWQFCCSLSRLSDMNPRQPSHKRTFYHHILSLYLISPLFIIGFPWFLDKNLLLLT